MPEEHCVGGSIPSRGTNKLYFNNLFNFDFLKIYFIIKLFRDSSAVERLPVKEDVRGSNPRPGAKVHNTNSKLKKIKIN